MLTTTLAYVPDYRHLFVANAVIAQRRYSLRQRLTVTVILFAAIILGGVFAVIGGVVIHLLLVPQVPGWVFTTFLFGLVFLLYATVLVPWQRRRSADFVNQARPHNTMHFTASDDGIRWQDQDIDFKLHWSGVEAIFATDSSITFMSGLIGLVLPRSAFPDQAAQKTFLADALSRIPAEAATKSRADKSLAQFL